MMEDPKKNIKKKISNIEEEEFFQICRRIDGLYKDLNKYGEKRKICTKKSQQIPNMV